MINKKNNKRTNKIARILSRYLTNAILLIYYITIVFFKDIYIFYNNNIDLKYIEQVITISNDENQQMNIQ